jgi:formylmethanofuran dehydrogenase subunit B
MTVQATEGSARIATGFVCPFCGLLCDDLPGPGQAGDISAWSGRLQALCPKAASGLAALSGAGASDVARIDGEAAAFEVAVAEAARRIGAARRPVIGGLGGDVQTMRAALALGDRIGARMLHRNQLVAQRNLLAQQSRGGITTTLAEVKQRAEMVVVVGGDVTRGFPRLLERVFTPDPVFADAAARRLVLLGAPMPQRLPAGVGVDSVEQGGLDLFESVALLRACLRGQPLPSAADKFAGLAQLARRMAECRYGVIVWAAAELDVPGADLLIEQMHQMVVDLNRKTRWAALPLAGNEGELTANAVATWQTGFPMPIEFSRGQVGYDPFPDYGDTDLLVWIGALPGVGSAALPGVSGRIPQVVIGAPSRAEGLSIEHVFIPVATPGVSANGHLVRTDGVITLYAPAVQTTALPTAASVIDTITAGLRGVAS